MSSWTPRRFPAFWALLLGVLVALSTIWLVAGRGRGVRGSADRGDASLLVSSDDTLSLARMPGLPADPSAEPVPASEDTVPDPALYASWTTYADAVRQSQADGKPVLLSFGAAWSEPAAALGREVFDDAAAGITVRAAVIPVAIRDRVREDGDNPAQIASLERRYTIETFPTLVVFSPATGHIRRLQGYPGLAETLRWIIEAADAVR
jgi:thiol:disulfide interchange protein